jgi:hypothetical protein
MTKLVVVLAVVVVVILVIVIIAARSMRAEDPEEFADRPGGREDRDVRYQRRERPAGRGGRGGRPSQRPGSSAGRGSGQRRDRGYDQRVPDGRGSQPDRDIDQYAGRGYDERRGQAPGLEPRSRSDGPRGNGRRGDGRGGNGRPEESQTPVRARPARDRRPRDSSEWDSSEWEKLSDVDYWAELASDKPLTTTAQPAAPSNARAGQARSGPDRDTEALTRLAPAPVAALRQDPATGLPVRGRPQPADVGLAGPAAGRADFTPAPVPVSGALDLPRPIAAAPGDPRLSRPADPASLPGLPGQGHSIPPARPRVDPDDDPLTSPSFPRIPAADSRSYRNGRTEAAPRAPRGSSEPSPYMAPTQQFASYGSPAPSFPGNGGSDTDATHPNGYRPDPLPSREAYSAPPGPAPAWPAAAATTTAGNPYGSYVTPDSQATVSGYSGYSGAHSSAPTNGHEGYLPQAQPTDAGSPASNGYWQSHPSGPGGIPDAGIPSYVDPSDPLGAGSHRGSHRADYPDGYGNGHAAADDPAGYPPGSYPPGSYPPGPHDPAGHAPLDPYGRDGYGGYPGYGAAGR